MSTNLIPQNESLPTYLSNYEGETGLEEASQYIRPPFLKIVQSMSSDYKDEFDEGDVLLVPHNLLVSPVKKNEKGKGIGEGEPFSFTPIFFYPEWCLINPVGVKPFIAERTTDATDREFIRKCRALGTIPLADGSGREQRYSEHLNFIVLLHSPEFAETPCVLSFSRGSFTAGSNFLSLAKMRKAPLFACNYDCRIVTKTGAGDNEYYSWNVTNPEKVSPFVTQEEFDRNKALHDEFAKAHAAGLIQTEYESENDSESIQDSVL